MLRGLPASAGIGIGTAVLLKPINIVVSRRQITDTDAEKRRYQDAIGSFCEQVMAAAELVCKNIGRDEGEILLSQCLIVRDPLLQQETFALIDAELVCVEYAFSVVCDRYIALFSGLEDELMRARAADFRDIKERLLSIFLGVDRQELWQVPRGSVLVADDISPSKAVLFNPSRVAAVVTRRGTRFSHMAIIARAMQIPAVVSVQSAFDYISEGARVIVDGESGDIYVEPGTEQLGFFRKRRRNERKAYRSLMAYRDKITGTADGKRIQLRANLAQLSELSATAGIQVDGVGPFRTEFLYAQPGSLPTEEEQLQIYKRILQALCGKMVAIRIMDPADRDTCAGQSRSQIFRTQLSALLRASAYGKLRIILPKISSIFMLREAKAILGDIRADLKHRGIPYNTAVQVGLMIDTPAAVMNADTLAAEADFFIIDIDELTENVSDADLSGGAADELQPAVLRMLNRTMTGARRADIPVSVCGGAASNPLIVPLLIGMGVDILSVPPDSVLAVRKRIAEIDAGFWRDMHLPRVLAMSTSGEIMRFLQSAADIPDERLDEA